MKARTGSRPWPIVLFAILVVGPAVWNLGADLGALTHDPRAGDEAYRIRRVSEISAQFLILVIPLAAIWLFASRIAKWLVTALSLASLARIAFGAATDATLAQYPLPWWTLVAVTHGAVLLLFTRPARDWFGAGRTGDARAGD